MAAPGVWIECVDAQNHVYYANPATKATSWARPEGATDGHEDEWWEILDESSGQAYYYQTKTKVRQWTAPTSETARIIQVGDVPAAAASKKGPRAISMTIASHQLKDDRRTNSMTATRKEEEESDDDSPAVTRANEPVDTTPKYLPPSLRDEIQKFRMSDYAQSHFARRKTGVIFRSQIPVETLMSYTTTPLTAPLLTIPKKSKRDAINTFRLLMGYMGDVKIKGTEPLQIAQQLVDLPLRIPEIRDEVYCQIIKQCTGNTNNESLERGWEAMVLCVQLFPCTKGFEFYLLNFLNRSLEAPQTDRCRIMAGFALRKLQKICREGPKPKTPELDWLQRAIEQPFNPSLFGSTLQEIMIKEIEANPRAKVPRHIEVLVNGILSMGGTSTVGIFRVPGEADAVQSLKFALDNKQYGIPGNDPNLPAGVLKLWMRELEEPIIPPDLYDACLAAKNKKDLEKVMKQLPEHNVNTITYIIKFLQDMAKPQHAKVTKMDTANIAMVFAPNFLRCPSNNPSVIFENCKVEQEFVRLMLDNLK